MKFTDGYWGLREGVRAFMPQEAREIREVDGGLTVFAPCRPIRHRGDTLNIAQLTLRLSSPMPDVIRVHLVHFKGRPRRLPSFELRQDADRPPRITRTADYVTLESGSTSVRVACGHAPGGAPADWAVDFFHGSRRLTGSARGCMAYLRDAQDSPFMREQLALGVGESIYGLGERFTPFVKNGQVVETWNEDGGTASEQAYKNVPFFLSSAGYGVLVAHPERVSFEVGSEVVSRTQFSVSGEELEYYVIGGATPKDVLRTYTALSGRPALPPAWSFGLWLTTSFTTTYDESTVNSFIEGMRERRVPLHVFHFDCFWMKELEWCDFEWDAAQFPDPAATLARLKEKGLRISVWINPYIAQKSRLFDEGMARGFLVRRSDGSVWQWDRWQAGMGLVDFTNPAAVRWYQGHLRRLLEAGVDCFKTDFGERIPTDVSWHDGSDPARMHNYYPYLYNRAVFEVLKETKGEGRALVFARSATVGCQKFPVHWGGDCSATYESMAESLRGGLSLGLSGFGFWSHDISGFEKTATPDLYRRWTAFGLLSSHSRLHGNESYRVPWLFGEESTDVLRYFVQLKCRLMPYLFAAAAEASRDGIPVMRAMVLEFPEDPACAALDRQYMLGPSLLVAPVFTEDGSVSYYLPQGRWTSLISGVVVEGGRWQKERHGYASLPLMVRPGAIVALGANETRPDYDYADGVVFHVFGPVEGETSAAVVVSPDGREEASLTVLRSGDRIEIRRRGARKPWTVCLRNVGPARSVEGAEARVTPEGIQLLPARGAEVVVVKV
ncbi:MAG TPA: alpha-xylosidase [Spirochaetia bacterium]|nr:alpha-xylosidase [Spirochaetia bacterium]